MAWISSPLTWLLVPGLPLLLTLLAAPSPRIRRSLLAMLPVAPLPALALSLWGGTDQSVEVRDMLFDAWFGLDEISRVFLFFTALLWVAAGWYANGYLSHDPRRTRFAVFSLLTMAGNFGLIVAQDAVTFYLAFAFMSLASYGAIVHTGDAAALRAGKVYIVMVMVGEVLLFTGMIFATHAAGSLRFPDVAAGVAASPWHNIVMAMLVAGFGIKVGALPLHIWLPLAHPAAPTPASAVLSGALIKAGLLGWMRFLPLGDTSMTDWGALLMGIGIVAAFWGAVVGVTQRHVKSVLAYSSISQMGFMTVGVGAALSDASTWPPLAAALSIYAMHHGLAKGALFLGVGVVQGAAGAARRWALLGLLVPALALAGAPVASGATAKLALKAALGGEWWHGQLERLLALAAVGTTILMARCLWLLRLPTPTHTHTVPATLAMWLPWILLVVASQAILWLLPWGTFSAAAQRSLQLNYAWALVWPVLLGVGLSGAMAWWARSHPSFTVPEIPAGDVLLPLESIARSFLAAWNALVASPIAQWRPHLFEITAHQLARLRARHVLRGAEEVVSRWVYAGLLFLCLVLTLLFVLR